MCQFLSKGKVVSKIITMGNRVTGQTFHFRYFIGALFFCSECYAAGFEVPHKSVYGVALANAVVADVTSYGAVPYNPSLMVLYPDASASIGVLLNTPKSEVTTASGTTEGQREDRFLSPYLHASAKLTQKVWAGISVNSPFGQGTDWDAGTFTAPNPFLQAVMPTQTQAKIIAISPAVAFRVNKNAGFSLGVDYYNALTTKLDTQATRLQGDGEGIGWQLGAFYRNGPISYAARYHSPADLDLEGDFDSPAGVAGIEAELNLPYRFQAGLQYQYSPQMAVEFDYVRVGWSSYDTLTIKNKSTGAAQIPAIRNDWRDVNALRLGGKYKYSDRVTVLAGYSHERTPQHDETFSPRTPGNNRNVYSLGTEYAFNSHLTLNAAYIFVNLDDREPDTTGAQTSSDHNGTDSIAGEYDSRLHGFGLSITYKMN